MSKRLKARAIEVMFWVHLRPENNAEISDFENPNSIRWGREFLITSPRLWPAAFHWTTLLFCPFDFALSQLVQEGILGRDCCETLRNPRKQHRNGQPTFLDVRIGPVCPWRTRFDRLPSSPRQDWGYFTYGLLVSGSKEYD
jgi:hypothetical protein